MWVIERNKLYLYFDEQLVAHWTPDSEKALRFDFQSDAEEFSDKMSSDIKVVERHGG